ncbi:sodium:proton antiporter [Sporosarcina luteola]|uniref:Sodium:proton antiporter n=1 Tax=Sporosarcina luteola TaxID=582850 RepID=A0A511Z360_9BACL|nr:dicarboxylate/amino acid:cation symporter [Sporosarcina luteola]GEN81879.1 sodium:proton antiporter [Sporosarcina luteola]
MFKKLREVSGKTSLATKIFIGLGAGILAGIIFGEGMLPYEFIGKIWVNLIKMILIPLILFAVISSITSQKDTSSLGRLGLKAMVYFGLTTIVASVIGILLSYLLKPGKGFDLMVSEGAAIELPDDLTVESFFMNLVSSNMFQSFSEGNMIQVIVIAILLGIAALKIEDVQKRDSVLSWFNYMTELIFSFVWMVIRLSPIGVFFLMAGSIGQYGPELLGSFSKLIGTFYLGILAQIFLVYGIVVWFSAKVSPLRFVKDSSALWLFTISTTSSVASIPVNLDVAKNKFKLKERISNFIIPLGSQINHDGNAILLSCIVVFTSQATGVDLTFFTLIKLVLLGTLISSGGGGIPGSGIIKVMIVVEAFGLPIEIGAMAAAFYRLFDMGITTANCMGDLAGAVMIDKTEKVEAEEVPVSQ